MVLLFLHAALAATLPDVDAPIQTSKKAEGEAGVVIGIEEYFKLPTVPYAKRDAEAFYRFLLNTRGVPAADVGLLTEGANREQILAAVDRAVRRAGPEGTVWVYFSGHGAASPTSGERSLLGADVQQDLASFEGRAVTVSELQKAGQDANLIFVLDTCYSGRSREGGDLLDGKRFAVPSYAVTRSRSRLEWSAASPAEFSGPLHPARHGAFTYFVLGALRGWADADGNGTVTAAEAQDYVVDALASIQVTDQNPVLAATAPDTWALATLAGHAESAPTLTALDLRAGAPAVTQAKFSVDLDVSDALALKECERTAAVEAEDHRKQALADAVAAVEREGSRAWSELEVKSTACLELERDERAPCIEALNAFLEWGGTQQAALPEGFEAVETACGTVRVALEARTREVDIAQQADAREMLRKMGAVSMRGGAVKLPPRLALGTMRKIEEQRALSIPDDPVKRPRKFYWDPPLVLASFKDGRILSGRQGRLTDMSQGALRKEAEAGWPNRVVQFLVHDQDGAVLERHEAPIPDEADIRWRVDERRTNLSGPVRWVPTPRGGVMLVVSYHQEGTQRALHLFEEGTHRSFTYESDGVWPGGGAWANLAAPDRVVSYDFDRMSFWTLDGKRVGTAEGQYAATVRDAAGIEVMVEHSREVRFRSYLDRIERFDLDGRLLGAWKVPHDWGEAEAHVAHPQGTWSQRADRVTVVKAGRDGSGACVVEGVDVLVGGDTAAWSHEVPGEVSLDWGGPDSLAWGPLVVANTQCGAALVAPGEGRIVRRFDSAVQTTHEQGDTLVMYFLDTERAYAIDIAGLQEDDTGTGATWHPAHDLLHEVHPVSHVMSRYHAWEWPIYSWAAWVWD